MRRTSDLPDAIGPGHFDGADVRKVRRHRCTWRSLRCRRRTGANRRSTSQLQRWSPATPIATSERHGPAVPVQHCQVYLHPAERDHPPYDADDDPSDDAESRACHQRRHRDRAPTAPDERPDPQGPCLPLPADENVSSGHRRVGGCGPEQVPPGSRDERSSLERSSRVIEWYGAFGYVSACAGSL